MGGSAESTDSENDRKEKSENADMLACIATLTNGKSYPLQNPKMEEGKTTPKKHFTEDSLLSAMERAGADEMPEVRMEQQLLCNLLVLFCWLRAV